MKHWYFIIMMCIWISHCISNELPNPPLHTISAPISIQQKQKGYYVQPHNPKVRIYDLRDEFCIAILEPPYDQIIFYPLYREKSRVTENLDICQESDTYQDDSYETDINTLINE